MKRRGHSLHCFRVARYENQNRAPEGEEQQHAIQRVINRSEVVVLLLVKNHEAVVLLHKMIIGPERREEEEDKAQARQHHRGADYEKEQGADEQTLPGLPLSAVKIGAR